MSNPCSLPTPGGLARQLSALASLDDDGPAAVALSNFVVLQGVFRALDGTALARCATVCRLWHELLCSDAGADVSIWKAAYLADYGQAPQPHEWLGSYRAMYARASGLLSLPAPKPLPIDGSAICYNAATRSIVTFAPHTRMLRALGPDGGGVRARPVLESAVAGALGRPLLAALAGDLVVLTAGDGVLQLWDVRGMVPAGTLGAHSSPLTSLSADGSLVGSTCASELKLWEVDLAAAASAAAAASSAASPDASATDRQLSPASGPAAAPDAAADPAASAALQPLTLAQQQAGRALAGRCLSTVSIGLPMPSPVLEPKVVVCGARRIAALSNCSAPVPSSVVRVYCAHPATAGALLRELSVNAAADMAFAPGRLLVAAVFHGRSLGGPERAFTIVVHCWDTDTWAWTRLVSPRLSTIFPVTSGQGLPLIHFTQEWLLCATPTRSTGPIPSCSVNAWRLPRPPAAAAAAAAANGGSSSSDRALRLRAAGGGDQQQEGRGGGQQQPAQRPPVLLVVGDSEGHDPWYPVLAETGPGRLAVLTSTPDKLLLATPEGQVRAATICPRAEAAAVVPARAVAKAASVLAAANAAAQL